MPCTDVNDNQALENPKQKFPQHQIYLHFLFNLKFGANWVHSIAKAIKTQLPRGKLHHGTQRQSINKTHPRPNFPLNHQIILVTMRPLNTTLLYQRSPRYHCKSHEDLSLNLFRSFVTQSYPRGVHYLFYFAYTYVWDLFIGGYLPCKKDYKVMVFYM